MFRCAGMKKQAPMSAPKCLQQPYEKQCDTT